MTGYGRSRCGAHSMEPPVTHTQIHGEEGQAIYTFTAPPGTPSPPQSADVTRFDVHNAHCQLLLDKHATNNNEGHALRQRAPLHTLHRVSFQSIRSLIAPWIRRWHAIMALHGAITRRPGNDTQHQVIRQKQRPIRRENMEN